MLTSSLLLAVFLGALVSGWHCALMCGGIAAAIERPNRVHDIAIIPLQSKSELLYLQLIMHLGRLTTYTLLGALCFDTGRYTEGTVWFQKAIAKGAKPQDQDSEIKRILQKNHDPKLIAHLLNTDPSRFAWVKSFANKFPHRNKG
jgi:hypothetical protein